MLKETSLKPISELTNSKKHFSKKEKVSIFLKRKLTELDLSIQEEYTLINSQTTQYTIKATHHGTANKIPIFFVCYLNSSINEEQLTFKGTKNSDNGVAAFVLLEVIRFIKEQNLATGTIEFIFSFCEPNSTSEHTSLDLTMVDGLFGYILESTPPLGTAITESPFIYSFNVNTTQASSSQMKEKEISTIVNNAIESFYLTHTDNTICATVESVPGLDSNLKEGQLLSQGTIKTKSASEAHQFVHNLTLSFQHILKEKNICCALEISKLATGFQLSSSSFPVSVAKRAFREENTPFIYSISPEKCPASSFNALGKETLTLSLGRDIEHHLENSEQTSDELTQRINLILQVIKKTPKNRK